MRLDRVSRLPKGVAVVLEGRAAALNGTGQDLADGCGKLDDGRLLHVPAAGERVDSGRVEAFVRVDVPHPCDRALIEKRGLDRPGRPVQASDQRICTDVEGVRPEPAPRCPERRKARVGGEPAETPGVAEYELPGKPRARRGFGKELPADMAVAADLAPWRRTNLEGERTCHPKLHHEHGAGVRLERELLPMSMGGADDRVREKRPRDVMRWDSPPFAATLVEDTDHVAPDDRDGSEAATDEMRLERSP